MQRLLGFPLLGPQPVCFQGLCNRRPKSRESILQKIIRRAQFHRCHRGLLTDRIYQGMAEAWKKTTRQPIAALGFQSTTIDLKPRTGGLFDRDALTKRLTDPPPVSDPLGFRQCLAAFGLSWRERFDAGIPIELPALDFGPAQLLLLPAESYVEYQLAAQKMRPDSFVVVMGYGESAPGYIPTQQAIDEDDSNLHDWCWVAPGAEAAMREALARVLKK